MAIYDKKNPTNNNQNPEARAQQSPAPVQAQQSQQPTQTQVDATAKQWEQGYSNSVRQQGNAQQTAASPAPRYNSPDPDQPAQVQSTQYPATQPAQQQSQPASAAAMKETAAQWQQQAQEQAQKQIDYATQQGITELERAKEDAQEQFKTQQKQIARDEAIAKDNSALYAEMRGDKGGIGQAQYNAIANAAAANRQTVAGQQSKLSTDTARQIADLRARGEFDKADKLLEISQNYLTQLMSLEQWAMEYGLSEEQFNEAVRQWEAEFQNTVAMQGVQNEQWQQSHDESIRQWEAEFGNLQSEQERTAGQWQQEFDASQNQLATENQQWDKSFAAEQEQLAIENQLAQDKFEQDVLESARAASQWQKEFERLKNLDNVSAEQWQKEYENMVSQQERTAEQWEQEFANLVERQGIEDEQWVKEFENKVSQQELTAEQWEKEFLNLLDQQDLTAEQWEKEFENMVTQQQIGNALDEAALTGKYNGELTLQGKNQIADMAMVLMDAGIGLTDDQLSALGISREQLDEYQAALTSNAVGGGGGGGGGTEPLPTDAPQKSYQVSGVGEITDTAALDLINKGYLEVTGKDAYGAPVIKTTAKYTEAVKKGDNSVIAGLQLRK